MSALYQPDRIFEAAEMIRPGYLIGEGDNRRVDYGVGPSS